MWGGRLRPRSRVNFKIEHLANIQTKRIFQNIIISNSILFILNTFCKQVFEVLEILEILFSLNFF